MKKTRSSYGSYSKIWISFFFAYKLIMGAPFLSLDDPYIFTGNRELINYDASFQTYLPYSQQFMDTLVPYELPPAPQKLNDPQILLGITQISQSFNQISTYFWKVTCQSFDSLNTDYVFTVETDNVQLFHFNVSYLIFEKGPEKKVTVGETNYQLLLQPGDNFVKETRYFPSQFGLNKFMRAYITGIKKTKANANESMNLSVRIEVIPGDNEYYYLVFELNDPIGINTIDVVYWNVLEYYLLPDEVMVSDNSDVVNQSTINTVSGIERHYFTSQLAPTISSTDGLFFGIRKFFFYADSVEAGAGIFPILTSNKINFDVTVYPNTRVQEVLIEMIKLSFRECTSSIYDQLTQSCVSSCSDGYYLATIRFGRQQCFLCDPTCSTCSAIGANSCISCLGSDYLYQNTCLPTRSVMTYCDSQKVCTACNYSTYNCKYCDSSLNLCLECDPGYFRYNGVCDLLQPPGTNCDPVTLECWYCFSGCLACLKGMICTSCNPGFILYNSMCHVTPPTSNVYCSGSVCVDCLSPCLDCGTSASDCTSCQPGFILESNTCKSIPSPTPTTTPTQDEELVEKESIISKEAIEQTSETFNNLSQGSVYVATALTFSSGFVSSGSPLLSQVLTTQKAFYLLLINTIPPKFLFSFISSLSDNGVLQQFSSFNALSGIASDSSEENTIGNQFQEQKIPSDIFINAGGGIIAVSVLGAAFLLFVVLENSRLNKIGMILYEKVACGIIVETFQVSVLIFTFSILICLTNTSEVDAKQIVLIIFCSALIGFVLIGQGVLLWKDGVSDSTQSIVKKALVQKLQNECIKERLSSRMYMIAFLTIECFIFPLIIVVSHNNGVAAAFSLAFVQVMETAMTIVIRPCVHMRETVFLIIEQTIFSCILTTFAILTVLLEAVEDSETSYPASVNTLSMIITIFIVAAVLLTPVTKLFRISIILKDLIKARMEKAKLNANNSEKESINKLPQRSGVIYPSNLQSITNVEILDEISTPLPESQVFGENIKLMRIQSQFRESQNSTIFQS